MNTPSRSRSNSKVIQSQPGPRGEAIELLSAAALNKLAGKVGGPERLPNGPSGRERSREEERVAKSAFGKLKDNLERHQKKFVRQVSREMFGSVPTCEFEVRFSVLFGNIAVIFRRVKSVCLFGGFSQGKMLRKCHFFGFWIQLSNV